MTDELDSLPWEEPGVIAAPPADEPEITYDPPKAKRGKKEEPVPEPENGLVRIEPKAVQADHHIVTGMAMLARMDEGEFQRAMQEIEAGQRRIREFQERVMVKGEDYGTVSGIARPFLHLPGAEKLCLLYGLAARQEADRIVGEKDADGNWLSPPITYHVRTYIHVGSFDGPIVAMGYGEANSWEIKYRYVTEKPSCPRCGKELMTSDKEGSRFKGKWFCPGFKGGCWWSEDRAATNADGSLKVPPPQKVENKDPYSLTETLIQMAGKRSFVAATRRGTGTSGLFTQDEDSPSVEQQSEDAGDEAPPPEVESAPADTVVERGAVASKPSPIQIETLAKLSREKELGPEGLARVFERFTGQKIDFKGETDKGKQGMILVAALNSRTAEEIGNLITVVETGDLTERPAEATA